MTSFSSLDILYMLSETPYRVVSGTPTPEKNYLVNEDIVAHIAKVRNSQTLKSAILGASDEIIESIILFILQLVDTPTDLEGSILAEDSIIYLLREIQNEGTGKFKGQFSIVDAVAAEWFAVLKDTSADTKKFYLQMPHYENAPLLTCHVESLKTCKLSDGTYPLYATYAYEFHKRLRFCHRYRLPKETWNACVRTIRYFFHFCSAAVKSKRNLRPDTIPLSVANDFKSGYTRYRMEKRSSDSIGETADVYWERLRKIWHLEPILPRTRFRKGYRRADENQDHLTPPGEPLDEHPPGFDASDYEIEDDDDEGEWEGQHEGPSAAGWDFGHVSGQNQPTTTRKDPEVLDYKWHDQLHLRNHHFFWERKYLDLFHFSMLYLAMQKIRDREPLGLHRCLVAYFYILIHTGMSSRQVLFLRGPECSTIGANEARLLIREGRFYIEHPHTIRHQKGQPLDLCKATSGKVYIPLPDRIVQLLKDLPEGTLQCDYVFSHEDKNNRFKHLKPDSIFAFLNDVNASFSRYTHKITLARIANSFQPLYHHRYGLDPIIACHISGRDRQKLYGSQMHYIHIDHDRLAREYLTAFNSVDFFIRENLDRCIEMKLLKPAETVRRNKREPLVIPKEDNFDGYGSHLIPKGDYISNMINALKSAVSRENDMFRRHNLFSIYTYLGLQFCTASRPRNNPPLPWKRFNARSGTILINDKLSARYREERLLPLPEIMRFLLSDMNRGFKTVEDHILRNHVFSDQSHKAANIFFFINALGRFEHFTLKEMREKLSEIGIDYGLPANMPRHFLRTYLFDANITCDLADTWMGHQHVGRETLGITSSVIYDDAVHVCMPHIDKMMQELGFSQVAYLPNHA